MTWEQKLQACQSIGNISLHMRRPGDWYVNHSVERVEGPCLSGGCVSDATTPEKAVDQHWAWLTDKKYPVIRRHDARRVQWNGFMWEDAN